MPKENDDQRDILRSIKAEAGHGKKWATHYSVGVADLVCSLPGIGIFLMEVKEFGNKLTPKQEYEKKEFEKAGGLVVVCYVRRKVSLNFPPLTKLCFWNSKKKVYEDILDAVQRIKDLQPIPKRQYKVPAFVEEELKKSRDILQDIAKDPNYIWNFAKKIKLDD